MNSDYQRIIYYISWIAQLTVAIETTKLLREYMKQSRMKKVENIENYIDQIKKIGK